MIKNLRIFFRKEDRCKENIENTLKILGDNSWEPSDITGFFEDYNMLYYYNWGGEYLARYSDFDSNTMITYTEFLEKYSSKQSTLTLQEVISKFKPLEYEHEFVKINEKDNSILGTVSDPYNGGRLIPILWDIDTGEDRIGNYYYNLELKPSESDWYYDSSNFPAVITNGDAYVIVHYFGNHMEKDYVADYRDNKYYISGDTNWRRATLEEKHRLLGIPNE